MMRNEEVRTSVTTIESQMLITDACNDSIGYLRPDPPGPHRAPDLDLEQSVGARRRRVTDELELERSEANENHPTHPIFFENDREESNGQAVRDCRRMTRLLKHRVERLGAAVHKYWPNTPPFKATLRVTQTWNRDESGLHPESRIADLTLVIENTETQEKRPPDDVELGRLSCLCRIAEVGFEHVEFITGAEHYIRAAVPREDYLFRLRDVERYQLYRPNGDAASVDFDHIKRGLLRFGWNEFSILHRSGNPLDYQFFQQSMGHPSLVVREPEASQNGVPIMPPTSTSDLTLGEIIFKTAIGRGHQPVAFFSDPANRVSDNAQVHIIPAPVSRLPTVPNLAAAPSIEAVELTLRRFSDHRINDEHTSELERLQVDGIELQRLINHLTNPNGDATNRQGNIADQIPDVPSFARYSETYPSSRGQHFEICIPDRLRGALITLNLPGHWSLTRILDAIALKLMDRLPVNVLWYWSAQAQITFTIKS